MSRDPRRDPIAGDVLERQVGKLSCIFSVISRCERAGWGPSVRFEWAGAKRPRLWALKTWIKANENSTVIKRGVEEKTE